MINNSSKITFESNLSDHSSYESDYDRISSNSADIKRDSDEINFDLLRPDQLLDSSESRIPILDDSFDNDIFGNTKYVNLEVQATMENPYLLLEFISCLTFKFIICSNTFMFAYISSLDNVNNTDIIVRYIIARLINFTYVAAIPYIFTTPDTYKSINVLLEYLMINIVIFEYEFVVILKYLCIHIIAAFLGSMMSYGLFYEYTKDLTIEQILPNISISSFRFQFNFSYVCITVLVHIAIASSLTIISNDATSMTAKGKTIHKALCFLIIGLVSGFVIGPIGYILPRLCLYVIVLVAKKETQLFNGEMFITYVVIVLSIIVLYPIIAIQIKFFWRNKFKRYIEYGSLK